MKKIIYNKIMEYGATAHNRIVCASGLKPLGLQKTAVGATRLCAVFFRHIFLCAETAARFLYRTQKNVIYNRNVMRNTTPTFSENIIKTYFLKEDLIKLCKKYNLPTNGSKENLLEYIGNFIENKPVEKIEIKTKVR